MRIELLLFFSVLATLLVFIACSAPRRPSPSLPPTFFPALTLTTYNPQFVTRVGQEAAFAATVLPATARPSGIAISPPRCYQTISQQITCLGTIHNRGQETISDISLKASFQTANGTAPGPREFSLEQWRIPAGETAPYRLQVPAARLEAAALALELGRARSAPAASPRLRLIEAQSRYQPAEQQYHYSATLINEGDQPAADIRLIVWLEDEAGAPIAYRALDLPAALPAGESQPVSLSLRPLQALASGADAVHRANVQSRPERP